MRKVIPGPALSLTALLVLAAACVAQPPGRRPGPPGPFGPPPGFGGPEQRFLDDLNLPEEKRETAGAAVREYQDNLRRLAELAGADLLAKLKAVLSADDYKKLREATARFGPPPPPRGIGRRLGADDVVERLMAFDKNKDGKLTKDELPERMQDLIARGDTNKDGALDRDEVRKLAEELAREEGGRGFGRGGRFPPGRGGPPGSPLGAVERALRELKPAEKQEAVEGAVKASRENLHRLAEMARADVLLKLSDVLDEGQLTKFKVVLDRAPEREGPPRPPPPFERPDPE